MHNFSEEPLQYTTPLNSPNAEQNHLITILLISGNKDYKSYFKSAITHPEFSAERLRMLMFDVHEILASDILKGITNALVHVDVSGISNHQITELLSILNDRPDNSDFQISLWGVDIWNILPLEAIGKYNIRDIRNLTCPHPEWMIYAMRLGIRSYIETEKVKQLKMSLEQIIIDRTKTLTDLNKKLQGALVANTNMNTKYHQQRIQIEQQNKEINERNQELEKAFKKSSAQHIKLQKALYLNEKQRQELEKVINETNLINNRLQAQNEEIRAQNDFIESQNEEIQSQRDIALEQHDLIKEQQDEIRENIQYAKHIQTALLPPAEFVSQLLPHHFILNKPKDVVSGDFYWISQNQTKTIVAVADCTGHGISGAMMSMLGTAFLNEIVNNNNITSACDILNQLRNRIITSLHQRIEANIELSRDGMDISIVIIDIVDNTLEFAGANNPIYLFRNQKLIELKPDKMPIGIHEFYHEPFHTHLIQVEPNDMVYMFSDGFADQFGGPQGKKLKYHRFKEIFAAIQLFSLPKQRAELEKAFNDWKQNYDQIDDVLVMGFRL